MNSDQKLFLSIISTIIIYILFHHIFISISEPEEYSVDKNRFYLSLSFCMLAIFIGFIKSWFIEKTDNIGKKNKFDGTVALVWGFLFGWISIAGIIIGDSAYNCLKDKKENWHNNNGTKKILIITTITISTIAIIGTMIGSFLIYSYYLYPYETGDRQTDEISTAFRGVTLYYDDAEYSSNSNIIKAIMLDKTKDINKAVNERRTTTEEYFEKLDKLCTKLRDIPPAKKSTEYLEEMQILCSGKDKLSECEQLETDIIEELVNYLENPTTKNRCLEILSEYKSVIQCKNIFLETTELYEMSVYNDIENNAEFEKIC